tara:strand:+ start:2924 stop:3472 length:549 start_codon:yes stop_codon:yes gene_type:complete
MSKIFVPTLYKDTYLRTNNVSSAINAMIRARDLGSFMLFVQNHKGLNVNKPDRCGINPIFLAIEMENIDFIKAIVSHRTFDYQQKDETTQSTPAIEAAKTGDIAIIKEVCVSIPCDFDYCNKENLNVLRAAKIFGNSQAYEFLSSRESICRQEYQATKQLEKFVQPSWLEQTKRFLRLTAEA